MKLDLALPGGPGGPCSPGSPIPGPPFAPFFPGNPVDYQTTYMHAKNYFHLRSQRGK